MIYAYILENGSVAITSVPPRDVEFIEVVSLPAGPRDSLRIVKGKLVSHAATRKVIEAKTKLASSKKTRDEALNALTYDLGDGRVMQVRLGDEQYIKGAIELMEMLGETSTDDWVMQDNKKYTVTIAELRAGRMAGLLGVAAIFKAYNV
tara:strand:- start:1412 stop:1858 length:447 start_codon:yes stop_codon:yes gene_type:complete